jgi:hypothetical protein
MCAYANIAINLGMFNSEHFKRLMDEAKHAMSLPHRNCDRPFGSLKEFQRYYIEHGCKNGLGTVTDGEITKVPWKSQFEQWMLDPQEEPTE